MNLKKLLDNLKRPHPKYLALVYPITLVFVASSMIMLAVDHEGNLLSVLAYLSYALAAVTLSYSVYLTVIYAKSFKKIFVGFMERWNFTNRMLKDWGFKTVVLSTLTFGMSLLNSTFNAFLGISEKSIWYGALAAYYIFLSLMRGGLLLYHRQKKDFENEGIVRAKRYMFTGVVLLILNAALSSAIAQMIFDDRSFEYKDWFIYAFATYAFYKIFMSVRNALKARYQNDLTVQAIRNINIVDSAVSILALQTALLHTFSTGEVDISMFNTLTGSAVSILSMALSIHMILNGARTIRKIKGSYNGK